MTLAVLNLLQFVRSESSSWFGCNFRHPMALFYVWILFDLAANVIWEIYQVKQTLEIHALIVYMPATFKVLIGVEQIWLMIELVFQINKASRILSHQSQQGVSDESLTDYESD